jgi:drug/metabolite transporter (DMT)-like permease
MERKRALVYLLSAAVLWSLGGMLIKLVDWHPLAIAGARSTVSALFLLATVRRLSFGAISWQIGSAGAYASTVILFVLATKLTTAANAILLQYTAPIYVALLSYWFLRERVLGRDWAVISSVFGGLLLFFLDRLSPKGLLGNLLAILSGMSFAVLTLLLRRQGRVSAAGELNRPRLSSRGRQPSITPTGQRPRLSESLTPIILGNVMAAAICSPFILGSSTDLRGWLILIGMGILQLGVPYILYTRAISHVRAVEAIVVPMIEPVLNPIWVYLALGERPGPWSILGGGVVIMALTVHGIVLVRGRRAGVPPEQRGRLD